MSEEVVNANELGFSNSKPDNVNFVDLFRQSALQQPENIAISMGKTTLSYAQLHERAQTFSYHLRHQGVQQGDVVAIYLERSIDAVIAILGVALAGATYLPMDVNLPQDRNAFILEDAQPALVVVNSVFSSPFAATPTMAVTQLPTESDAPPAALPDITVTPESSAYLIYTSGSTGRPKGAVISHRGLATYLAMCRERYSVNDGHGVVCHSPISFDLTVTSLLAPLAFGQRVIVIPDGQELEVMAEFLAAQNDISLLKITPAHLRALALLIESNLGENVLPQGVVRTVVVGGEELTLSHVQLWLDLFPMSTIFNEYGPTETVVGCCIHEVIAGSDYAFNEGRIPIGLPIDDVQLYIVDENWQPVEAGQSGELWIAGESVSHGYLFRSALTADKFLPDCWSSKAGARLYRSGDVVRRLPNGEFDFLGRIDRQVKVRGYRVEPGEIEQVIRSMPIVKDAAVLVQGKGDAKSLCACIEFSVPGADFAKGLADIRATLSKRLPYYMVPQHIADVGTIPLTANGKVDTKALAAFLVSESSLIHTDGTQLTTETERDLQVIWENAFAHPNISADYSFFEYGGNSLVAVQMLVHIRRTFAVQLAVIDIFEHATIPALARLIDTKRNTAQNSHQLAATTEAVFTHIAPRPSVTAKNAEADADKIPLSYSQQRLFFLNRFDSQSTAYNVNSSFKISGHFEFSLLERAIHALALRHEAFRTTFATDANGEAYQTISAKPNVRCEQVTTAFASEAELHAAMVAQANQAFDIENGPLLRVSVFSTSADTHYLLVSMHHIICDGLSSMLFWAELSHLYHGLSDGQLPTLAELPIQYADYAYHQRQQSQRVHADGVNYWLDSLADAPLVLDLPFDLPRPTTQTFAGLSVFQPVDRSLVDAIRQQSQSHGLSVSMFVQAAFYVLLNRLSGQQSIVLGVPSANRQNPELSKVLGFFVNSLPIRVDVQPTAKVRDLLLQVKERMLGGLDHESVPFDHIVDALGVERDPSTPPVFQVMYAYEPDFSGPLTLGSADVTSVNLDYGRAIFDLVLRVIDNGTDITLCVEYDKALFLPATVQRYLTVLLNTLDAFVTQPDTSVSQLSLMSAEERQLVLHDWNEHHRLAPSTLTDINTSNVASLFETQAARRPDAIALRFGGQTLTYGELNRRANQVAHHLHHVGVKPTDVVGLMIERSLDMMIAMLGIIKAGGVYCPLDLDYPEERLHYIVQDSGLQHCVVNQLPPSSSVFADVDFIVLDDIEDSDASTSNPDVALLPKSGIYIMYTSGSTGKPKGVYVEHLGVIRLVCDTDFIRPDHQDVFLQLATPTFDASTLEIWGALLNGGELILAPPHKLSVDQLGQVLARYRVTILWIPTAFLNVIVQEDVSIFSGLHTLIVGGEVLPIASAKAALDVMEHQAKGRLLNSYGPTENTTFTSCYHIQDKDIQANISIAIGQPIAQTQLYVLNESLEPLGAGMVGELYIGGAGITRGYIGKAAMTAERFIPNPYGEPGSRLYRTGDLVCWRADGSLAFVSRVDFQVKIRGFRVEIGEIEATLARAQGVQDVLVLAKADESGTKRLIAYVVGDTDADQLRCYLRSQVPDFMVPSAFVVMDTFPLNRNGKVDRAALPVPTVSHQEGYVAPQTEMQSLLCQVWADVLNVERIGLNDNFFDLGGDSILSIQIASRINKAGFRVQVKDIFSYPSVGELAPHCEAGSSIIAEQGEITGGQPLLPIHRWFYELGLNQPNYWNQSFLLSVPAALTPTLTNRILARIVAQHDALRLRFSPSTREQPTNKHAFYAQAPTFDVREHDLSNYTAEARNQQLESLCVATKQSLSIDAGPLVNGALFTLGKGEKRLLLTIHHLVIDTVSWRVLIEDFNRLYEQALTGSAFLLDDKTSAYQQWGEFLNQYASSESLQGEVDYWRHAATLAKTEAQHFPRRGELVQQRAVTSFALSSEETRLLLENVHDAYNTQVNDVLLGALLSAYQRWSSHTRLALHLEGHGREQLSAQLDLGRTVGWFTTIFPVTLQLSDTSNTADLAAYLISAKETLRAIPNKGIGYGVLRYCHPDPALRAQLQEDEVTLSFNYLGQFDQSLGDGPLQFATESSGGEMAANEIHAHGIDVVSMVTDGVFRVNFQYDTGVLSVDDIQAFSSAYRECLLAMIRHCCTENVGARTPSDFALAALEQQELDDLCRHLAVNSRELSNVYPLSPLQEGMLFESLQNPESGVYITQVLLRLASDVAPQVLQAAWNDVINAFPILRTAFSVGQASQPLQAVLHTATTPLQHLDWRDADDATKQQRLQQLITDRKTQGFDYSRAPVMALTLIQWADNESKLLWSHHHVLIDGWSLPHVLDALNAAYQAHAQNTPLNLPYSAPYAHYMRWLQQQDQAKANAFWGNYLADFSEKTPLPLSHSNRPAAQASNDRYGEYHLSLSAALCEQLNACARRHRVTLNTLVQAAWGVLIGRCVNSHDVVFGSVSAGRPPALNHAESIVGAMITTTPVRVTLSPEMTIGELLSTMQSRAVESRDHEHYSLSKMAQASEIAEGERLFDSVLAFENYPFDQDANQNQLVTDLEIFEQPHGPLTLAIIPGEQIQIHCFYAHSDYDEASIARLLALFRVTLDGLSRADSSADCRVDSLNLLTEAETQQVLTEWNTPATHTNHFAQTDNLATLFDAQAALHPQAIALVMGSEQLSYAELNRRANHMAAQLTNIGVSQGAVVGLMVERSFDMIVAMLAIIKTGAMYCPLDASYPEERIRYIIEDSGLQFAVLDDTASLPSGCEHITRFALSATVDEADLGAFTLPTLAASSALYIMYTSGSTGQPKGVVNTHAGVMRLVRDSNFIDIHPQDVFLQLSTPSFDASTLEIWGALLNGVKLVLAPAQRVGVEQLGELLAQHKVSTLWLTAAFLNVVVKEDVSILKGLRYLLAGGDVLSTHAVQQVLAHYGESLRLINGYGPTENTTFTCCHQITANDVNGQRSIPIGQPISHTQVYVLNQALQPLGAGMVGELYTSGEGLAWGYFDKGALTAERFIPNPFGAPGSRLYRTGDLASWRSDGTIEFIGRADFQTKIRGFRIELGEVEATLARAPNVQEVIVLAREDEPGIKRLVAYLVATASVDELRHFAQANMPNYMVPSAFVVLERFPLNANGKVDRRALPVPHIHVNHSYQAPQTAAEKTLCGIWESVLNVDRIGLQDNFFELGGDSILALQIASRTNKAGFRISVKDIFNFPSVGQLAPQCKAALLIDAEQGAVQGEQPLLPVQHWFFAQHFKQPEYYNQSFLLKVPADLSLAQLNRFMQCIEAQHDVLRLRVTADGQAQYVPASDADIAVAYDLSGFNEAEQQARLEQLAVAAKASLSFAQPATESDVSRRDSDRRESGRGELYRCALVRFSEQEKRLFFTAHHLIIDTISWRIIIDDLRTLYQQAAQGEALSLGEKTTSYQRWAQRLNEYASSDAANAELSYWQHVLQQAAEPEVTAVASHANQTEFSPHSTLSARLDAADTRALLEDVHAAYNTQINDILLSALLSAYHEWSGAEQLRLNLEGHGREDLFERVDLSRTLGWFTSIFPVNLQLGTNLEHTLISVKETLNGIPHKGVGFGVLRYLHPDHKVRTALQQDTRQISFNYLGQFGQTSKKAQFDQTTQQDHFDFATESTGADISTGEKDAHALNVVSLVSNGCLSVDMHFDEQVFSAQEMQRLLSLFISQLQEHIRFCSAPENGARTPSDFALAQLSQSDLTQLCTALDIDSRDVEDIYPLASVQRGMLFESLRNAGAGIYVTQFLFTLPGNLDVAALEQAWGDVIAAFPIFRTAFALDVIENSQQLVMRNVSLAIQQLDWRPSRSSDSSAPLHVNDDLKNEAQLHANMDELVQSLRTQDMDFSRAPLMKLTLVRVSDAAYKLVWTHHHALVDGWSLSNVYNALNQAYAARVKQQTPTLAYSAPYKHYVEWLERSDKPAAQAFWREYLQGFTEKTPLPYVSGAVASTAQSKHYGAWQQQLSTELCEQLNQCTMRAKVTLNTLVQAAWGMLLGRIVNSHDVVFGAVSASRPVNVPQVETIVGAMITTVPVRVSTAHDTRLQTLLGELQDASVHARNFEYTPLATIQSCSELSTADSLFDTVIAFENFPYEQQDESENIIQAIEGVEQPHGPLTLAFVPGKQLHIHVFYDEALYAQHQIQRLTELLVFTLESFTTGLDKPLSQLPILPAQDAQHVVNEWNNTAAAYPDNASVIDVFEQHANQTPDATALVFAHQTVSYRALNERANQLAHYLQAQGIGAGQTIGVMIERSPEMIIGILAILKAGATFCPIDMDYPEERIQHIVRDAAIHIVLISDHGDDALNKETRSEKFAQALGLTPIALHRAQSYHRNTHNLGVSIAPQAPIYVMYTSGSTGLPKGVAVTHQGVIRLVCGAAFISIDSRNVFLQMSPPAFDAATFEIWGAFLNGGKLVLAPPKKLTVQDLGTLIHQHGITSMFLTSAFFNVVVKEDIHALVPLKHLCVGGDVVSATSAQKMLTAFAGRGELHNGYGPTENTTFSTTHQFTMDDVTSTESLTIGKPIANSQAYVLNEVLAPLGVGMVGELYLGGAGLAHGYVGNGALTAERFVPNPFGPAGSRLYRTGDLARWRANGTLEFIGRVDYQVKIRGFRIELGEVETVLEKADGVTEVIALAREDVPGVKRLVAYVVGNTNDDALRHYLRSRVPDYMVPSAIMVMSAFPLTDNGKVDRRALPAPQALASDAYVAPETDAQRALCAVWADVFKVARIGLNDNFFDLGGDSILSIQIASRANKAGYRVTVKDIFTYPTIAELAVHSQTALTIDAEQGQVQGEHALLPIQQWFFEQALVEPDYWNQSFIFEVPSDVDAEFATQCLQIIVAQHDALRLRFDGANTQAGLQIGAGAGVQAHYAADAAVSDIAFYDLSDCSHEERAAQIAQYSVAAKRGLSLSNGPLVKGVLFDCGSDSSGERSGDSSGKSSGKRLMLTAHHLVIDTVSWRVLIEDFTQLYQQRQQQQALSLGKKTSAYQQWGKFLTQYAQSDALQAELPFWLNTVAEPAANFPQQGEHSDVRKIIGLTLSREETRQLLEDAHDAYNTQVNDILLAALLAAYRTTSANAQSSLRLHLEGHGREALNERLDLSRTLGWFTTLFPVTLAVDANQTTLADTLIAVKERLRAIPNKGIGYGVLRYCHPDADLREQLRDADTSLSFNYLGQFDQATGEGPFQFSTEFTGTDAAANEKHAHSVDVVGMVRDGVLGIDVYYDSGLHSSHAIQAFSDAYLQHLRELIAHCCTDGVGARTSTDFALANVDQHGLQALCTYLNQPSRNLESVYPLSPLQKGMLFESMHHEGAGVYITQIMLTFAGNVDSDSLQVAWNDVIAAFPILRTGFSLGEGEQALQAVLKSVDFALEQLDWRDQPQQAKQQRVEDLLAARKKQGVDFSQAPLMSAVLIRWSTEETKLLWTHHHALIDGWSLPQVFEALSVAYQARVQGKRPNLPYSAPYEHYVRWLQQQDQQAAHEFWANYLTGLTEKTPLPLSRAALTHQTHSKIYGEFNAPFSSRLYAQMNECARRHRVTLNTLVQAAWGVLLSRCVNSNDVVFGSVSAGRPPSLTQAETIVGAMIATTPVRLQLSPTLRVSELLADLQQQSVTSRDYEYASLASIQQASELPNTQSLFDTVLAFENYPFEEDDSVDKLILDAQGFEQPHSPLTLAFIPGEPLSVRVFYDLAHYDQTTIAHLFAQLCHTMASLSETSNEANTAADRYLHQLPILDNSQYQQVVEQWNQTATDYPQHTSVASVFEAQAAQRPEYVALRFGDQALTYGELNRRANQVAHRLLACGVMVGSVVGLMVERSPEMMIGLLGIIKAGAIYCPLEVDTPDERLRHIIADSDLQHCVVGTMPHALPALANVQCLSLNPVSNSAIAVDTAYAEHTDNLPHSNNSQAPMYIMYTSGSTGLPKGVLVTHEGVLRLVCGCDFIDVDHRDVFLQLSTPSFDASTLEIWGALLNGAELVLAPPQKLAVDELGDLLKTYEVTTLWLTAAFLNLVVKEEVSILKGLRHLLAGGDVLSVATIEQVLNTLDSSARVINGYGPTENTTFTCCHPIEFSDIQGQGGIPIGKPIANTQAYVLNDALEPLGVGMVGELYTSGAGLALGYLGQPALTADRFIPNPFASAENNAGSRLYRTGDLVSWRADGTLEFIGRVDFQVKIRGYRIELGDIETAVERIAGVKETVVLAREDEPSMKRLVAYVVGDVDADELRAQLRGTLPDYMLPSAFVVMQSFPLTQNGKVDRRALPIPDIDTREDYVAPESEAERALCDVWAEVFKRAQIGIHDNFFDLGGDSILSIQIASRANKAGYRVSVKDIFTYPTVAELAPHCDVALQVDAEQHLVEGEQALLPIQQWFFEQPLNTPDFWNQSFLFHVPDDFSAALANQYVHMLIKQHDALRLRFDTKGDSPQAHYADLNAVLSQVVIVEHDLRDIAATEREQQLEQRCLDVKRCLSITDGPVFGGALFTLAAGQKRLLLTAHHLVIDTVSWRVLIEDLGQLHAQTQAGQVLALGNKTSAYRQWGEFLQQYAADEISLKEIAHWQDTLAEGVSECPPFPQEGEANHQRAVVEAALSAQETELLLGDVHDAYNTQINDLLLAALMLAYNQWSSNDSVQIHLEGHGREALSEQLDLGRTVGWFTTLFPVTLYMDEPDLGEVLIAVKESLRAIPNKGIGYGALRYSHPDAAMREQMQAGDIAVSFNYLGQFDQSVSDGPFQFAPESTGADASEHEKSAHTLDVVSMVTEGELNVRFQYDTGAHSSAAMESLFDDYLHHLRELIAHCCLDDVGARTSSDFEDEDITEDILDDLWDELS